MLSAETLLKIYTTNGNIPFLYDIISRPIPNAKIVS